MSVRQQKIAAQIRRMVSEILIREIADPRVDGLVTVTKVEVTPDLHDARVYVSVLGSKRPAQTVLSGLTSASRRIQNEVAEGLPIRLAPHLSFALDETLKREAEMLRKIDEATAEDRRRTAESGPRTDQGDKEGGA
jgi:ribosome-binding factor A